MKNAAAALLLLALPPAAPSAQESALEQLQGLAPRILSVQPASLGKAGSKPGQGPGAEEGLEERLRSIRERIERGRQSRELFLAFEESGRGGSRRTLVVREDQLEKLYLFSATLERGIGRYPLFSTWMDETFLWSFRRSGNTMQLVRRQMEYRAEPGTPEARAVWSSIPDEPRAIVPIIASGTAAGVGFYAISADELFIQDIVRLGPRLQDGRGGVVPRGRMLMLSGQDSVVQGLRSFVRNMEVQAQLMFAVLIPPQTQEALLPVTMRYSLTALPEKGPSFEPRPADERVGHFTTSFQDLSASNPALRHEEKPLVHWVNRWNLEKADPAAAVSDVKNPVVFWLEDTVPKEYRPAIKAGVLAWNAAFEAIGLRNALAVKEVDNEADMSPEERVSFDPADIAYNTIRWFMGDGSGMAVGPSRANPLTGELFHASISMGDHMVRWIEREIGLIPPRDPAAEEKPGSDPDHREYLGLKRQEAAFAAALLQAEGAFTEVERQRLLDEFLTEVTAHEVGHTLGLRHNFRASTLQSVGELGKGGIHSSSVMDYLPGNIAPEGRPQGFYYQTRIGPYDAWAVEYAYKLLSGTDPSARKAELEAVAGRAETDPALAYGTDEDADSLDPDIQRFDLGSEPVAYARLRVGLVRGLWKRMESSPAEPDEDNEALRRRFESGLGAYSLAARSVLPVIGGWRTARGRGKPQFVPIPAPEQREALAFLEENVFKADPFRVSPQLLQRLGNERLADGAFNAPFPMDWAVLRLQSQTLNRIYSPSTLRQLALQAGYVQDPKGRLSVAELFDRTRRAVWSEVAAAAPKPVDPYRRNLQREHLVALGKVLRGSTFPDGRAAARRDLERIVRDVQKALRGRLEVETRLHLVQSLQEAKEFLDPARREASRPAV